MATVFDVAQYILEKTGEITTIKLQKLVYYCQAWSLVWDESPIFPDKIEAWANGPVAPALFAAHRGMFTVSSIAGGSSAALTTAQKETADAVLATYGDKPAQWLVALTHLERPWMEARGGCPNGAACSEEITHAAMSEYYSGLQNASRG